MSAENLVGAACQTHREADRAVKEPSTRRGRHAQVIYADRWREVYAAHREQIEGEWDRRGWTQEQREFVMTRYRGRGFRLAHDVAREKKMELWHRFEAEGRPGWDLRERHPNRSHNLRVEPRS